MCLSALANPKILSLFTLATAVNDNDCCKRIYLLCLLLKQFSVENSEFYLLAFSCDNRESEPDCYVCVLYYFNVLWR